MIEPQQSHPRGEVRIPGREPTHDNGVDESLPEASAVTFDASRPRKVLSRTGWCVPPSWESVPGKPAEDAPAGVAPFDGAEHDKRIEAAQADVAMAEEFLAKARQGFAEAEAAARDLPLAAGAKDTERATQRLAEANAGAHMAELRLAKARDALTAAQEARSAALRVWRRSQVLAELDAFLERRKAAAEAVEGAVLALRDALAALDEAKAGAVALVGMPTLRPVAALAAGWNSDNAASLVRRFMAGAVGQALQIADEGLGPALLPGSLAGAFGQGHDQVRAAVANVLDRQAASAPQPETPAPAPDMPVAA